MTVKRVFSGVIKIDWFGQGYNDWYALKDITVNSLQELFSELEKTRIVFMKKKRHQDISGLTTGGLPRRIYFRVEEVNPQDKQFTIYLKDNKSNDLISYNTDQISGIAVTLSFNHTMPF